MLKRINCWKYVARKMAKQPNDYTVVELKDILRGKNLSTVGNKGELIDRLTDYDPEIWTMLDGSRTQQRHGIDCAIDEDHGSRDTAAGEDDRCHPHNNNANLEDSSNENNLIRRENELLRRKRGLLQRELEIARQERHEDRGTPRTSNSGKDAVAHLRMRT